MLWEVQISKMANSLATFPSLLPRIADDLWFTLEKRLDDDAALTKEEEQYTALVRLPILSWLIFLLIFLWIKNKTLIILFWPHYKLFLRLVVEVCNVCKSQRWALYL